MFRPPCRFAYGTKNLYAQIILVAFDKTYKEEISQLISEGKTEEDAKKENGTVYKPIPDAVKEMGRSTKFTYPLWTNWPYPVWMSQHDK